MTRVVNGGVLSDRKGVNVPGVVLPLSALTEKDRNDLHFGLKLGVDWVALSFVRRPEDVAELRTLVKDKAGIVAKLEKPADIAALDAIVAETDAVMVARGDLGVEMPPEAVPAIQKRIVDACRRAGKPVIVATQMLESMVQAPVPTRAEASDVATAIYEGADAVMLSAESASGRYPVEAVRMMSRIVTHTEDDPHYRAAIDSSRSNPSSHASDAIGFAMRHVTELLRAAATVAYTSSGYSALRMARERPSAPIIGMTPHRLLLASEAVVPAPALGAVRVYEEVQTAAVCQLVDIASRLGRIAGSLGEFAGRHGCWYLLPDASCRPKIPAEIPTFCRYLLMATWTT